MAMTTISIDDFGKLDIRVGTIIDVADFPEARKPTYKLRIDFGPELGIKASSAQITDYYKPTALLNRQVIAVVNFAPKKIGTFTSEVLVLGGYEADGTVRLLRPERPVANGVQLK